MRLLTPFGLAAAGLAVPLVLWYLLRARRPRVEVSSTFLWRRSGESVTAAVPWQRFRADRTFWLVLAAIVLGALALARPALPVDTTLGAHTIVIVDASASMLADEDGPTRLELARREVAALLDGLGPGQTVSVIEAAARARILVSGTPDAGVARDAVASVTPTQGGADLADAVVLAASLAQPGQPTVTHLITDHAPAAEELGRAPDDLRVTAVGADRDNLAITRIQAVPATAGVQVFAQVRNFGVTPADVDVRLTGGDAELAADSFRLAARQHRDLVLDVDRPPSDRPVIRATVTGSGGAGDDTGGTGDALALDDTAFAVVPEDRTATALVAGPGNVFVEQALTAAGVQVRTAPLTPDDLRGIDLLVVDRVAAPARPTVPTIALAPTRPFDGVTADAAVDEPVVTFQQPDHPLLSDVDLSALAIASATPVTAPDLTTVAAGPDGPLIVAGRSGGQPVIHVGFDVLASNLPLDVAWPVLISNAVQQMTGATATAPVAAGTPLPLDAPAGATGLELTTPGGNVERLDATVAPVADQVGVWQARWTGVDAPPTVIAVNAVTSESDLVAVRPSGGAATVAAAVGRGLRVFGPGIAAVVLALLLAEWVLAHRRTPADRGGRAAPALRRFRGRWPRPRSPRPRWPRPRWPRRRSRSAA